MPFLRRCIGLLSTAAWLAGMYVLYARCVTPRVEPYSVARSLSPQTRITLAEDTRPLDNVELAQELLSDEPWTATARIQLQFGDLFLYANRCLQLEQRGEVRFEPFALVRVEADQETATGKPREPLRISCAAALVRFENAFDLANPNPGRPVYGALEGVVVLQGPDNLFLRGHGFQFDEKARRLWSDRELTFRFGSHSGTGQGVQLDFEKPPERLEPDSPAIGPLSSVSLLRKVSLTVRGSEKAGRENSGSVTKESHLPDTGLQPGEEMFIHCDGRLHYQIQQQQVTLDRNVRVRHPRPDGTEDLLLGELLTLDLRSANQATSPESTSPITLVSRTDSGAEATQPWEVFAGYRPEVVRLTATGTLQQPVSFASPLAELSGHAESISYELETRQVEFQASRKLEIRQRGNVFHGLKVNVQLSESGRDVAAVNCTGPGDIEAARPDGQVITASWTDWLQTSRDDARNAERIELHGAAQIAQGPAFSLTGRELVCWWVPEPDAPAGSTDNSGILTAGQGGRKQLSGLKGHVQRLEATGDVVFTHEKLSAQTQKLIIDLEQRTWSEDLPFHIQDQDSGKSSSSSVPQVTKQAGQQRGRAPKLLPASPAPPATATADHLELVVWQDPVDAKRIAVVHLTAEGRLDIRQNPGHATRELRVRGQRLEVDQREPAQATMHLSGSPALISMGASRLETEVVDWSREEGLLRVPGAGSVQHPIQSSFDGRALAKPQPLVLSWKEKLEFDGRTAHLYEKVVAKVDHSQLRCYAMHVALQQAISLKDLNWKPLAPEQSQVESVICESQVELEDAEYEQDRLMSIRRGKVGRFVLDNLTGRSEALGRGWLIHWRRGQALTDLNLKPGTKTVTSKPVTPRAGRGKSNAQPDSQQKPEWTYLRVDFAGSMRGNLHEQFTTFDEGVEIVYGPVKTPTQTVDPDHLPAEGAWMRSESLRLSRVVDPATKQGAMSLLATGNTELEALTFHARADSIKYDELKGLYIIQSLGTNKATIRKQPTATDPRGHVVAQRITVNPALSHFHVDQFISGGVSGGQ